jgi:hypothetical protein
MDKEQGKIVEVRFARRRDTPCPPRLAAVRDGEDTWISPRLVRLRNAIIKRRGDGQPSASPTQVRHSASTWPVMWAHRSVGKPYDGFAVNRKERFGGRHHGMRPPAVLLRQTPPSVAA